MSLSFVKKNAVIERVLLLLDSFMYNYEKKNHKYEHTIKLFQYV